MNKWIFFSLLFLLAACDATKKTTKATSDNTEVSYTATDKCKIPGKVKDYSDLDGCKFMIELENGQKWTPAQINDASFTLIDGQQILFGYKEIKDAVNACMAGNKIIEVTCIKAAPGDNVKPYVKDCLDINDPNTVPWMGEMIGSGKVNRIIKYNFRDGWAYMMMSRENRYFYDCQGTDLCPQGKGDTRECIANYLPRLSNPTEIYNEGPDD